MIPLTGLVQLVVTIIVVGLICYLLIWLVDYCGIPEPFNKVARVIVAVVAVLLVIVLLLSLVNGQPLFR